MKSFLCDFEVKTVIARIFSLVVPCWFSKGAIFYLHLNNPKRNTIASSARRVQNSGKVPAVDVELEFNPEPSLLETERGLNSLELWQAEVLIGFLELKKVPLVGRGLVRLQYKCSLHLRSVHLHLQTLLIWLGMVIVATAWE